MRITGEWSKDLKQSKRIPPIGYVIAVLCVATVYLVNFL